MPTTYTVTLQKIIDELGLKVEYLPQAATEILVASCDVNRPGLALTGFYEIFDAKSVDTRA